jgi:phospholipid/cholesterol/gamma-HCH transport system substrate-binding protein
VSQKASPALVGGFVLGGLLLGLAGIVLLGTTDLFKRTYPFVAYFEGSVDGLSVGSPVKYKGVEIGKVDEIRLELGTGTNDPPIVVFFSLDAAKLKTTAEDQLELVELERAIDAGLRVQLEQQSLLTGLLFVSLDFHPDSQIKLHAALPGFPEIPSVPMELEQITNQVKKFVQGLEDVDMSGLVKDVQSVFQSLDESLGSGQVQAALTSLDQTLAEIRGVAASVKQEIAPLAESLRHASDQLGNAGEEFNATLARTRETIDTMEALAKSLDHSVGELTTSLEATLQSARTVIDPSSPPVVRLEQALADLSATARAARSLLEILERDPAALLRGKAQLEDQR